MKMNLEIELTPEALNYYRKLFDEETGSKPTEELEDFLARMASLLLESLYDSSVVR